MDAFTPNEAIHSEYENTCSVPDCLDNEPGTQKCNECNWFNFEQLKADLNDNNPDNDWLSIPFTADDYFYGAYLIELIPNSQFLDPINRACV